ncbi:ATP-binding protein [Streptomyces sp. YIM B13518]|uniref:hybrid sensor histidine kinase/response regulator n=1 Tax=Streptomyces sp. YIM B13518 TaxID=3366316 RepID=UPI0036940B98
MTSGAPVHELATLLLMRDGDVVTLRRCAQAACRAAGLTGGSLVRLTTVVSEAGEQLKGASDLTAQLCLEERDGVCLAVRFDWRGAHRPPSTLLTAASRLLDGSSLRLSDEDGRHRLVLAQRIPAPTASAAELAGEVRGSLVGTDTAADLIETLRTQNRHLLAALDESQRQQEELQRLNAELEETNAGVLALYSELASELEETNSGVVALYAELEDKTRQLELADAYKTRFWANVSHELRSPVNSVIALAQLLLDTAADPLSDEQRQQVAMVHASGSTLLALVDELLDVAKAESGRLEPHLAEVDLRSLLHQLRGMLQSTARPGVDLRIPDRTPHGTLVTDEVMLTRILRNVLSNALKFTGDGAVVLDVAEEDREDGARVVFRVEDTGVGIPPSEVERVFEEFYQVRGPHQRGRPGTGLGLPYARKLTELLGGTLRLDSEVGVGTRVVVEIPARPAARERRATAARGPVPSVLVVDDDEAFVTGFRAMLKGLAETVTTVTDSAGAVAAVERVRPDVVFLDLTMPNPDGYEVRRRLALEPATADVPVIVLTALEPALVDRTRLTGAHAVLNKSYLTTATLADALERLPAGPPAAQESLPARPEPSTAKEQHP